MTTKSSPMNSAADEAVLAATRAAIEKGEDPFGDEGDDTPAAAPAAQADEAAEGNPAKAAELPDDEDAGEGEAAKDEAAAGADGADEGEEGDDDELDADALEAVAADEPGPTPAPPPRRFQTADTATIAEQRKELRTQKEKLLKDMIDGVIDPDAYSAQVATLDDKLDGLLVQSTLHEANVQTEQQSQADAVMALIESSKKAGTIDYMADTKAQKQFDVALQMIVSDPDDAKLGYAAQVAKAHEAVLALRGIGKPAAAPAPATAGKPAPAQPRENGKGPATLRNVPAAATPNSGGGLAEQMAGLSGAAYEAAFEKLTPAQKAMLRGD